MAKKSSGGSSGQEAAMARQAEADRQDKIRKGTRKVDQIFGDQFTDDFFTGRQNAFNEYAAPQLEDQFGDAKRQLTFALARNGTLDSTIRATKEADLQKEYDNNARAVSDKALAYGNEARGNVESSRADLIKMLNSTGDVQGSVNSALSRANTLSAPDAFSPLGPMFANFTAGLAQQAALERASHYSGGAVKPYFNTGLFANTGSVKVT
jgi:hypothetical protein